MIYIIMILKDQNNKRYFINCTTITTTTKLTIAKQRGRKSIEQNLFFKLNPLNSNQILFL